MHDTPIKSLEVDDRLPNPYSIDGPRPFTRPRGKSSAADQVMSGIPVPTSSIPRFQPSSNDGVRSRTSLDKQSTVSGIPVPVSPSSIPRPLPNDNTRSRTSIDAPVAAGIASTTSLPSRGSMSLDLPNPFDKDNKRGPSSDYQRGMSRVQGGQRSAIPVPAMPIPSPKIPKPTPLPPHSEFGQVPPPGIPGNLSLPLPFPPPAAAPASPKATPSMIHARNYSLPLAHPRNRADSAAGVVPPPAAPLPAHTRGHSVPLLHPNSSQSNIPNPHGPPPSNIKKPGQGGHSGIPRPSADGGGLRPSADVSSMDHSAEGRPWPRPPKDNRPRPSMEGSRLPVAKPRMAQVIDGPDAQFPRAMQQAPAGTVQIVTQPKGNQGMKVGGAKSAEGSTMSDSSAGMSEKKHEKDEYTYLDNKPLKMSFCWCCYYRC